MAFQPGAVLYTQGFGSRPENIEVPHIDIRDPTVNDFNWPIGKMWINRIQDQAFILTSISSTGGAQTATWISISNIPQTAVYPITPYVVGPLGVAGYQTIQSALDAANAAGDIGAQIYIQPGSYVENLTLYPQQLLCSLGFERGVVQILGSHSVPSGSSLGVVTFQGLTLEAANADLINVGSATTDIGLIFVDCRLQAFGGAFFTASTSNATGTITFRGCTDNSATCVVINAPGADLVCLDSFLGAAGGNGTCNSATLTNTVLSFYGSLTLHAGASYWRNSSFLGELITLAAANAFMFYTDFFTAFSSRKYLHLL